MPSISEAKILILATDGFENSELFDPRDRLIQKGAHVTLASPGTGAIQGVKHDRPGDRITPDLLIADVKASEYDALLLPGGVANPDRLRMDDRAVEIVEEFADDGKLIAAICHAPWLLIEADVVDGVRMTSWPSVRTDLANAGASVVDEEVVRDGQFITSRKPDDIPAFNRALIAALEQQMAEA